MDQSLFTGIMTGYKWRFYQILTQTPVDVVLEIIGVVVSMIELLVEALMTAFTGW